MAEIETLPEIYATRNWYLLWAPRGVGSTLHIVGIQEILRRYDQFARVWYPLKEASANDKVTMVPFYAGYMFVQCLWTPAMEVVVRESMPCFVEFIKELDTMLPIPVPDDEVRLAQEYVEMELKSPNRSCAFEIGDNVRVLQRSLLGLVGPVVSIPSPNKIMVELPWFNRPTPTLIDVKDLELL